MGLELFLEVCIMTLLSLKSLNLSTQTQGASSLITIALLLLVIWFMIFIFIVTLQRYKEIVLVGGTLCMKYWTLFEGY
jgi:hypothetical protein